MYIVLEEEMILTSWLLFNQLLIIDCESLMSPHVQVKGFYSNMFLYLHCTVFSFEICLETGLCLNVTKELIRCVSSPRIDDWLESIDLQFATAEQIETHNLSVITWYNH